MAMPVIEEIEVEAIPPETERELLAACDAVIAAGPGEGAEACACHDITTCHEHDHDGER